MGNLLLDLRHGWRALWKARTYTIVAILTLSLGIGAATTIFIFVDSFLLRPLPFTEPDRLVHVWETNQRLRSRHERIAIPDYFALKEQNRSFDDLAAFNYTEEDLTSGERPERIAMARVSSNVFEVLGVQPALGRGFRAGEDRPGSERLAVLSHGSWQRRFAGDPHVLGRQIAIDGAPYTIVGVMPPDFVFPLPTTELWAPRVLDPASEDKTKLLQVVGRLKPGVTRMEAAADLDVVLARLAEKPDEDPRGARVLPLREALNFASDIISPMALVLSMTAMLILLVACANVGGLSVARTVQREREIAIRTAMGASRWRIARQLLVESLLLATFGAAAGLLVAEWKLTDMRAQVPPDLYRIGQFGLDGRSIAFTAALVLITALLFGLAPALSAGSARLNEALKEGSGGSVGPKRLRLQTYLTVGQIALTLVLLVAALMTLRSLSAMRRVDLGFSTSSTQTLQTVLPVSRYPDVAARETFHRRVVEKLASMPGVASGATTLFLPLNHESSGLEFARPEARTEKPAVANVLMVSPEYFRTLAIPVLAGREFTLSDDSQRQPVVIISRSLAQRHFAESDPVGRTLVIRPGAANEVTANIIGVVGDTRHRELGGGNEMHLYFPLLRTAPSRFYLLAASKAGAPPSGTALSEALWELDPLLAVTEVRTLPAVVDEFLLPQRSLASALVEQGSNALLLALVGIYALMTFFVAQRTREIGIRMALGAGSGEIVRLILARGGRIAAIGLALGIGGGIGVAQVLRHFLFGISMADAVSFATAVLVVAGSAMVAIYIPARRATRVDPAVVLRNE